MTNTNQDVTLDEMAKAVVEWMDGWVIQETKPMTMIARDGRMSLALSQAYESLDVIREVEEAINERIGWKKYVDCLVEDGRMFDTEHPNLALWWGLQADPETRLRAIYATLRENGEIE